MKTKEINSKFVKMIMYGIDNEIGIDTTYHLECKTLWLRFLCFYLTIMFK